jgi:hypothetical protein
MDKQDIIDGLDVILGRRGEKITHGDLLIVEAAIMALASARPEELRIPEPEPEPHSYALLKLEGAEKPLFFVMEERYGSPAEEDYQSHRRYFYEEHSCPTNWIGDCVAVIENGDTDPHGYLTFVRSAPVPPGTQRDEENWEEIFPEAFPSPQRLFTATDVEKQYQDGIERLGQTFDCNYDGVWNICDKQGCHDERQCTRRTPAPRPQGDADK